MASIEQASTQACPQSTESQGPIKSDSTIPMRSMDGLDKVRIGEDTLQKGATGAGVKALYSRLLVLNGVTSFKIGGTPKVFDEGLAEMVTNFQRRHNSCGNSPTLPENGIVAKATMKAIDRGYIHAIAGQVRNPK